MVHLSHRSDTVHEDLEDVDALNAQHFKVPHFVTTEECYEVHKCHALQI